MKITIELDGRTVSVEDGNRATWYDAIELFVDALPSLSFNGVPDSEAVLDAIAYIPDDDEWSDIHAGDGPDIFDDEVKDE